MIPAFMPDSRLKFSLALVAFATPLVCVGGARAVQTPVKFAPVEPVAQVHAGEGEIDQVRAEVPFTLRAYPQGLEAPATYSWAVNGDPDEWCSTTPTDAPEITLTLPAGHYEIGICVNEENGSASHCVDELDVIPAGPIADFKISTPPMLDLSTFREHGARIPATWGRAMDTTYRAEVLANFDGRSTHSYPLQFVASGGQRKPLIRSDNAHLVLRIAPPTAGSPVSKLLRRAEDRQEHVGTQIFIKPDVSKDPAWGGLQDEFTFGATVALG